MIGISYSVLNEITNGKRPINTEYALKIEAATRIPAYLWPDMQLNYNMQTAHQNKRLAPILAQIGKVQQYTETNIAIRHPTLSSTPSPRLTTGA